MNIRYGKAFRIPRKIAKYTLSFLYPIIIKIWPLPKVFSIDETIDKILNEKASISRYGDSEFLYIIDKINLPYQEYNELLSQRMKEILISDKPNVLIGLPIGYHSLDNLVKKSKLTWRSQIAWIYPRLRKYLRLDRPYYNSSMTRFYIEYENKNISKKYFLKLRKLWEGRDVLLVEGDASRLGVGNDLFNNASSVKRILGPRHHAFKNYDELYNEVLKFDKSHLIMIAMGPTATVLSYDLALKGYQALDIGNIDIEYEWFQKGVKEKVKVEGKYTSEASGGRVVEESKNKKYISEIVANFSKI